MNNPKQDLLAQTVDAARVLTLNRPERRNALTPDMALALAEQVEAAGREDDTRAVLIRGAGGHFCVGLDLKWFTDLGAPDSALEEGLAAFQGVVRSIVSCPLPVVAVLEGSVAGIGFDIALACDIRIASDAAVCTSAFASMGLVPDGGSTFTLPRLVGQGNASSMLIAGEAVDAETALAIGLVSAVHAANDIDAAAAAVVRRIAANARISVVRIKHLVRAVERDELDGHLTLEGKAQLEALRSDEFRARLQTFLEQRGSKASE